MKHKLFAAPLLSLVYFFLFFYPIKTGELNKKPEKLIESQMAISAAIPAEVAPVTSRAGVSLIEDIAQGTGIVSLRSLAASAFRTASFPEAALREMSPELRDFMTQVSDGSGTDLRGVHIQDVLSLKVVQQPEGNATFVSTELGNVTQFQSAARNGVTGLLAHNYLSGELFYNIAIGQEVDLIYENGRIKRYQVSDIESFQKLTPSSLRSDLIDLSTGRKFTTSQVFKRFYTGKDHITFQTCLEGEGISNWGLTFFVATPLH
jgi:hypothetical protein